MKTSLQNRIYCRFMKYFIVGFVLFCHSFAATSQNLVSNPSFERYDYCPTTYTIKPTKQLIPGWYLPTKGTSDYFNSCTNIQVNVPKNFIGYMYAKDGQAYIGMILLEAPLLDTNLQKGWNNYREYIQAELKEPLVSGKRYVVKFHYAIATYSTYAVNNVGIYFSQKRIKNRTTSNVLNYSPQVEAETNIIKSTKDVWFEVVDTLTADGGEQFITIGNFYSSKETKFKTLDITELRNTLKERIKENRIAYYYIDDVSVTQLNLITTKLDD